jgi:hypothetical protein
MCKLFSLFTWQYFTFKYIFKIFMKVIMNLEACCFKCKRSFKCRYLPYHTNFQGFNFTSHQCFQLFKKCLEGDLNNFIVPSTVTLNPYKAKILKAQYASEMVLLIFLFFWCSVKVYKNLLIGLLSQPSWFCCFLAISTIIVGCNLYESQTYYFKYICLL